MVRNIMFTDLIRVYVCRFKMVTFELGGDTEPRLIIKFSYDGEFQGRVIINLFLF